MNTLLVYRGIPHRVEPPRRKLHADRRSPALKQIATDLRLGVHGRTEHGTYTVVLKRKCVTQNSLLMIALRNVRPQANKQTLLHVDWPNEFEPEEICTLGEQVVIRSAQQYFRFPPALACKMAPFVELGLPVDITRFSANYQCSPCGSWAERANVIPQTSSSGNEIVVIG